MKLAPESQLINYFPPFIDKTYYLNLMFQFYYFIIL